MSLKPKSVVVWIPGTRENVMALICPVCGKGFEGHARIALHFVDKHEVAIGSFLMFVGKFAPTVQA